MVMALNDLKLRYYRSIFGSAKGNPDLEPRWFQQQFGTRHPKHDDFFEFFKRQGYRGNLNDMWVAWLKKQLTYTTQTRQLLTRMTTQPTVARQAIINTAMSSLVTSGLLAKADMVYFTASHSDQSARLNWASTLYGLTANGSPTFVLDRGLKGNSAANSYYSTGAPNNGLTNYKQDNATLASWETENIQEDTYTIGTASLQNIRIAGRILSGAASIRVNTATAAGVTKADSLGMVGGSRSDAANQRRYINGAATTGASTSAALTTSNFTVLRSAAVYSNRRVGFVFVGASLSDAEHLTLYNLVRTYMIALGASA